LLATLKKMDIFEGVEMNCITLKVAESCQLRRDPARPDPAFYPRYERIPARWLMVVEFPSLLFQYFFDSRSTASFFDFGDLVINNDAIEVVSQVQSCTLTSGVAYQPEFPLVSHPEVHVAPPNGNSRHISREVQSHYGQVFRRTIKNLLGLPLHLLK
jgi:hypothetical protein